MKKNTLVFLLALFVVPKTWGQTIVLTDDEKNKMEFSGVFKSSISLELGGKSGFSGVSYDLLLTQRLRVGEEWE